jgi:hypothetical protein
MMLQSNFLARLLFSIKQKGSSLKLVNRILIICCVISTLSCGRYGKPLPPEKFSPSTVTDLEVIPEEKSINFHWTAPQTDTRGEELMKLKGYRIYRRTLLASDKLLDPKAEYNLLFTVEDRSIEKLEELREEAIKELKTSRKIALTKEERASKYTDDTVLQGESYLYKIVPFNHRWVDGDVDTIVKVDFKGAGSSIEKIPFESLEKEVEEKKDEPADDSSLNY